MTLRSPNPCTRSAIRTTGTATRRQSPAHQPVDQALLEFTGQTPGNLIAVLHNGVVIGSAVFSEDEPRPAPPDVVRAIEARSWPDAPPRTEKMGSLGSYRMDCGFDGTDTLVVGVSLNLANRIIARKNITTTALVAGALLVTAVLTVWMVGYTLRPLRRVAATAAEVAAMQLTDDEHQISARVRPQDTDPDNEVGIVGNTLNRLLDNVDSALAHRADSDLRMRQFIADASHELRTPLAAIQGYAELTRQDSSALPPTTEYALARIESEARRMTLLVDELLLLSRLGEGEDLQTEDVDLADVVINAVNDAAVAAPTHHWIKDLPDEPMWVRGDHARLHQLVSNLLSNARVHTPPGVTVTTGIARHRNGPDAPYAELTVDDDGPGIDAGSPAPALRAVRPRGQIPKQWVGQWIGLGDRQFDRQGASRLGQCRVRRRPNNLSGAAPDDREIGSLIAPWLPKSV